MFPTSMDILFIAQNPGQLHKRKTGWNDADYAFVDDDWQKFQKSYAKGLNQSPIGTWIDEGFYGEDVKWGLTNIVKCRTSDNKITVMMIAECRHWTEEQLKILKPKMIVTLGAPAWGWWDTHWSIDRAEGKVFSVNYPFFKGLILPMYHPAWKNYKHDKFSKMWFQKAATTVTNRRLYTLALKMNTMSGINQKL